MHRGKALGLIAVIAMAIAASAGTGVNAQGYYGGDGDEPGSGGGYGMMGPWMMGPGGWAGPGGWMGPGMMYGYGPGSAGPGSPGGYGPGWGYAPQRPNLDLSATQVRDYLQRTIADNPHLKVGPVTVKDSNTIVAEIVTADNGSLVERFSVDRHTGFYHPIP